MLLIYYWKEIRDPEFRQWSHSLDEGVRLILDVQGQADERILDVD